MSTFMLKNLNLNFTPISNVFIEKYMPYARGEFVKVYLLMHKHNLSVEPVISVPILASSLNLLESDIMNALSYWSDLGVIKLSSIDSMNNFSVEFLDLNEDNYVNNNKDVNLLDALENKGINDMLKDIEKILGRTLSTKEMEMYLGWQKEFSFPSELILLLVEYCASKGKSDYRYIEKVALTWHDMNIKTMSQAQNYIKQTEDKWVKIRKILSYLGIKNTDLMKPQEEMLNKWIITYNFGLEMIQKACDICANRLNRADFKYIDGILTNWFNNNIKTLEDVALKDKQFKVNNNYKKNNYNKNNSSNGFNNFEARSYDYEALERKLLGWDNDD